MQNTNETEFEQELKKNKNSKLKLKSVKQLGNIDFFIFVALLKHKRTVIHQILIMALLQLFTFIY